MKVCYSRILCQERIREVRAMTIREEIEQLKKEKNAVILAHYYVRYGSRLSNGTYGICGDNREDSFRV